MPCPEAQKAEAGAEAAPRLIQEFAIQARPIRQNRAEPDGNPSQGVASKRFKDGGPFGGWGGEISKLHNDFNAMWRRGWV